jgi:hypothetical protein
MEMQFALSIDYYFRLLIFPKHQLLPLLYSKDIYKSILLEYIRSVDLPELV